ncbi:MAG: carbonate dehydratase [Acidobacteria bacterium]|nr:carbonate dehydratase [Acidobacteriota bacterium]
MKNLNHLFANNQEWANRLRQQDADFFKRLAESQAPEYLWIGCADSRVPPTNLVGLRPGELFVHRNVANVVVHSDLNCLSVLQFAIEVLHVKHVIVCGHYGCGGVDAALHNRRLGLIDNWLRHVQDVREKHEATMAGLTDSEARLNRLCELNVIEQVVNVCQTTIVQNAWERGQQFAVHGWVYAIHDGLLRDLKMQVASREELAAVYRAAVAALD